MPPKVLHIIDTLGMGGAETWLMEVLRDWAGTGAGRMDFLATSGQAGIFDEEARSLGAHIHYVRYSRRHLLDFAKGFRRVLREGRYDAVHDHQDYASGWHFLAAGGALPPVRITHVHNPSYQIRNNYGVTLRRRITSWLGKALVARYATGIWGTSRQVVSEYGFDEPQFSGIEKRALHCAFDPGRFVRDRDEAKRSVCREFLWSEDSRIVLFAGRMDQSADMGHPQNHKNSGFALDVVLSAIRHNPHIRVIFAGALSPALSVLEGRIANAGISGKIQFAGIRQDIERLMSASNVLLFPSRGEGLGMVAVEAQAAGLPVLASTAVPAECVVVPDAVTFLPIDAGVEAWADRLLSLAEKNMDAKAANAMVAASPFAIGNCSRALLGLYSRTDAPR